MTKLLSFISASRNGTVNNCPATSSIAVAALVQDEDALDGVVGRRKCWHRPVTGRIPRCRFNRHRSISLKN